jgi:hypothetical protein
VVSDALPPREPGEGCFQAATPENRVSTFEKISVGTPTLSDCGNLLKAKQVGMLSEVHDGEAYSFWVNRNYRAPDGINSFDAAGGGSSLPDSLFSHGFIDEIDPAKIPRYLFAGSQASELRAVQRRRRRLRRASVRVRNAFKTWSDITVDDVHLKWGWPLKKAPTTAGKNASSSSIASSSG